MGTGPWDLTRAGTPGRNRFLASDADRERAVDLVKAAFVQGVLTKDELDARTGAVLTARTYGQLAAVTAGLAPRPPRTKPETRPAARSRTRPETRKRRRTRKKVLAWGACAIVLPPALGAAFLSYYGGFLVMFAFMFLGAVVCSKPPAPPRQGPRG